MLLRLGLKHALQDLVAPLGVAFRFNFMLWRLCHVTQENPPPPAKYQLPVVPDDHHLAAIEAHPDILQVIGEIAVRWSMVELYLTVTLSALVGDHQAADTILNSLGSFKARCDVVRNSVTELMADGDVKEELLWLLSKIQDAHKARNDTIHAMWGIDPLTEKASRYVRRPGTKTPFRMEHVNKATLKEHSNRVASLVGRLSEISSPAAKPRLIQRKRPPT